MQSFLRSHHSKKSSNDPSSSQQGNPVPEQDSDPTSSKFDSAFECNICLETAKDAVVSLCGHLFCWPCLYQWLYATDSNSQSHKTCPVCKSAISREKTIPIYGRGGDDTNRLDPRDKLPPRPAGQRTEVPPQQNQFYYGNTWPMGGPGAQIFGFGDGNFHLSIGFGSLFGYMLTLLQGGGPLGNTVNGADDRRNDIDFFWMKFFAICGFLCIVLTLYFC